MPEKETIERAREDAREGKSLSTQAGEFVREEIHHVREGKHGARSTKQAIAIGLSKARRAGVKLKTPKKGTVSAETRRAAARDSRKAKRGGKKKPSARRSRAMPDDGNRYEVVYGELLVTPAPRPWHQVLVHRLSLALGLYLRSHPVGVLLTSPADISWVATSWCSRTSSWCPPMRLAR